MIGATAASIAGLLCSITFYVDDVLDWRNILLTFGGIHLLVFILLIFLLIGSPMFALNEEKFEDFSIYLRQIAKRNGKILTQEDFLFLAPYMTKESRKRMFKNQEEHNLNSSLSSNSDSNANEKHSQNSANTNLSIYINNNNNNINNNNNNIINYSGQKI